MDGVKAERIETGVDRLAATLFAGATAYALYGLLSGLYSEPLLGVFSAGAAGVAFLLCTRGLRGIAVEERFHLPAFDVPAIEPLDELVLEHIDEFRIAEQQPTDELLLTNGDRLDPLGTDHAGELLLTDGDRLQPLESHGLGELLLTASDRLHPVENAEADELVLEDILAELGPESRVVRLFDPSAMSTPGQLNARIERHRGEKGAPGAPPDASQALYDALAELRRSLG